MRLVSEAAHIVGPLSDQRGAFTVIVEPELGGLGGAFQTIEVGVDHRRVEGRVSLEDGERRRRHLARVTERGDDRARQRGLARTQPARQRDDIPRLQARGDPRAEGNHRAKVRQLDPHGRRIVAKVPSPRLDTSSSVPPCASTNWRASGMPRP